jgi:hypothetical protein
MALFAATVADAILAAFAALVGGALTTGSNLFLESRRGRREQELRDIATARETRQAARLLLAEIGDVEGALAQARRSGLYPPAREARLETRVWQTARPVLASGLDDKSWESTAHAFDELARLTWVLRDRARHSADGQRLQVAPDDRLDEVLEAFGTARDVLSTSAHV